jgi:hypothetical protein
MIIRPRCRREYVALPNALLNDRRLSADTRAMLAVLLSKPRGWELRSVPLKKLLSREGERPLGTTKLRRMIAEASAAGYIARTEKQARQENGSWGKYEYFVGMPQDVVRAVREAGVALTPQVGGPHMARPPTQNDFTNHKEQNPETADSKNLDHRRVDSLTLGAAWNKRPNSARRLVSGQEVIQQQLALRLGLGDAGRGWLLLGAPPPGRRDELTALERFGRLTDQAIEEARATAALAESKEAV